MSKQDWLLLIVFSALMGAAFLLVVAIGQGWL